ncbi:helix-turn-helix transcriptional regulator [Pseudopedobacter sp.]|uniref:helix-turn-helix domain-containing protein n=1 Tax=Pseudopedobacter sp. TaxID=1936787 RepID=UPI0033404194
MFEKEEENLFKNKVGERIKQLRTDKKYGLREFARNAEIEHHQLLKIEKGESDIRLLTLMKISKALKLHPNEILDIDFGIDFSEMDQ